MRPRTMLLVVSLWFASSAALAAISTTDSTRPLRFLTHDAAVWGQDQTVSGVVRQPLARTGVVFVNGMPNPFAVPAGSDTFSVSLRLREGVTVLVARVDSAGRYVYSDTLRLWLAYRLRPRVDAYATITGRAVALHGVLEENPDSASLSYAWQADPANPAGLTLQNSTDSSASTLIPAGAPDGEYYFTLRVRASDGDSARARTFVTVTGDSIRAFINGAGHARWIDSAILYEIQPSCFTTRYDEPARKFQRITEKIPELAELGVNTLWLMPVMSTTEPNHGYHTIDYFGLRQDFGTEEELRELVRTAHAHGLRVILDIVPNHTTYLHPWAQDAIAYGHESHFYDYYTHVVGTDYWSIRERPFQYGLTTFTVYFYNLLVNLNYENSEVQRMMIEAGRYWIEKFDIDGYRVDMIWAGNSRSPGFFKKWCHALKSLKPEVLLLAEDFAGTPEGTRLAPFDLGYDAAYDWTSGFKSPWSYGDFTQPTAITKILTNGGLGYPPGAVILRMLENSDLDRAIVSFGEPLERLLSGVQFSLQGIPMLFNGQEIGATAHPYDGSAIFRPDASIRSQDQHGLFPFFQKLARLRRAYPALQSARFEELPRPPRGYVYMYRRWEGRQNIFAAANLGSDQAYTHLQAPVERLGVDSGRVYYLSDLLNGGVYPVTKAQLTAYPFTVEPRQVRLLLLDTTAVTAVPDAEGAAKEIPGAIALGQNYPNPFNPVTVIAFELPAVERVRLAVYDILGREVQILLEGRVEAGRHIVQFDAAGLASGVYIYRLSAGDKTLTKKMVCLK